MKLKIEKILFVIVLVCFMGAMLWEKTAADMPLADVESQLFTDRELSGAEKADDGKLRRLCGLNASDYAEVLYYCPVSNMDVDELLIVKVSDESQKEAVQTAVENRLSVQKKNFDGYGIDQTDILNRAEIWSDGSYVCLIVNQDASEWLDALKKILGA